MPEPQKVSTSPQGKNVPCVHPAASVSPCSDIQTSAARNIVTLVHCLVAIQLSFKPCSLGILTSCALAWLNFPGIGQRRGQRYFVKGNTGMTRFAPSFLKSDADSQIDEC